MPRSKAETAATRKSSQKQKKKKAAPSGFRRFIEQRGKMVAFIAVFAVIGCVAAYLAQAATTPKTGPITGIGAKCLDNNGGRLVNYNRITLWTCNGGNNQKWTVQNDGSIQTQGWCLDVPGGSKKSQVYVQLYKCNGTVAQKWSTKSNGTIVNPNSGLCLDAQYSGTVDGTRIWMYTCNGTNAQKWSLPKDTTPPPTNPNPPTPTSPKPVGITGTWNIAFQDEFNGTTIDSNKWTANWLGAKADITKPINSAEVACYDPANAIVSEGELRLTALNSSCKATDGKTYKYRSGMVQSNGKFSYVYGVAEARVWLPAGAGAWPAFWSTGQSWPNDGEIDTLEAYGNNFAEYHYHYAGCGGDCGPGGGVEVPGATAGWHTYATKWEPGKVTWYYDGKKVWEYTTGITNKPLYLVANLGILGKDWDTGKTITPNLPYTYRVDYVRVWQ